MRTLNKSFWIAYLTFTVVTLIISLVIGNAVPGFSWGFMVGLLTYVFFEYVFFDDNEKKTEC